MTSSKMKWATSTVKRILSDKRIVALDLTVRYSEREKLCKFCVGSADYTDFCSRKSNSFSVEVPLIGENLSPALRNVRVTLRYDEDTSSLCIDDENVWGYHNGEFKKVAEFPKQIFN